MTVFGALCASFYFISHRANAEGEVSWTGHPLSSITSELDEDAPYPAGLNTYSPDACIMKNVLIGAASDYGSWIQTSLCVYGAKNFSYAYMNRYIPGRYGGTYQETAIVIGIGGDSHMYKVDNTSSSQIYKGIKGTDDFLYANAVGYGGMGTIMIQEDFLEHLTRVNNVSGELSKYEYNDTSVTVLEDENNTAVQTSQFVGISENRQWIVVEAWNRGIVLVNTDTFDIKWISTTRWTSYGSGANPTVQFAVSNDGKHVAWGGSGVGASIIDVEDGCGLSSSTGFLSSWQSGTPEATLTNPCPTISVLDTLEEISTHTTGSFAPARPSFSDDGRSVTYWWGGALTLHAYGYVAPPPLKYLALGDSYSSGEGDTEPLVEGISPASVYIPSTNVAGNLGQGIPKELCHVSYNSYPFSLAKRMSLGTNQWHTITCSGATMADDMREGDNASYLGQVNTNKPPRLQSYANAQQLKYQALTDFIPGRNKQIEFVKKYKPEVITLSAGGNDVGFSRIIRGCVDPRNDLSSNCSYVTNDDMRTTTGRTIINQYDDLVKFYTQVYNASGGNSKIYVVGYPQFVNDNPSNFECGLNVRLTQDERTMIRESVKLINLVIEKAALTAGVKYLDVEESLSGYQLCDDQTSVNGIIIPLNDAYGFQNQSFHPTAFGQKLIFKSIKQDLDNQDLLTYPYCEGLSRICPDSSVQSPVLSTYFTSSSAVANAHYINDLDNTILKPASTPVEVAFNMAKYTFGPNSPVNIFIYSDPEEVGTITSTNDGSLDGTAFIPSNLEYGYHTLVLNGKSYSGEDITYWQVVNIQSSDATDRDANGQNDATQACFEVDASGVDTDLDGVDDGCDAYISNPKIYRSRTGDINRIYNGALENVNYIYIERNLAAESITGIQNDYDPDGDGWAIVGASQGTPYTTESVPDTGPIANFEITGSGTSIKPYVYTRAGGYGCTSFTPLSLGVVIQGQNRTIKKVDVNTNQCRSESPAEDADFNGISDDTQPLYFARKGNSSVLHTRTNGTTFNEDPGKLYIFRSFHSSEAQIGISDYSPTGTAAGRTNEDINQWNLLASSQISEYVPSFNKLVILQDTQGKPSPLILTKKQNGQCVAYKPEDTTVIKKTTQYSRDILKLNQLPQGVSCD